MQQTLKPIFHCKANPLVLGPRVGLDPNARISRWDTNMLVFKMPTRSLGNPMQGLADPMRALVDTTRALADPTQASVIQFALAPQGLGLHRLSRFFTLGTQRERGFQWNMDLTIEQIEHSKPILHMVTFSI